eukprot:7394059-Lingulodinium_polyedra.AAC.1
MPPGVPRLGTQCWQPPGRRSKRPLAANMSGRRPPHPRAAHTLRTSFPCCASFGDRKCRKQNC